MLRAVAFAKDVARELFTSHNGTQASAPAPPPPSFGQPARHKAGRSRRILGKAGGRNRAPRPPRAGGPDAPARACVRAQDGRAARACAQRCCLAVRCARAMAARGEGERERKVGGGQWPEAEKGWGWAGT